MYDRADIEAFNRLVAAMIISCPKVRGRKGGEDEDCKTCLVQELVGEKYCRIAASARELLRRRWG